MKMKQTYEIDLTDQETGQTINLKVVNFGEYGRKKPNQWPVIEAEGYDIELTREIDFGDAEKEYKFMSYLPANPSPEATARWFVVDSHRIKPNNVDEAEIQRLEAYIKKQRDDAVMKCVLTAEIFLINLEKKCPEIKKSEVFDALREELYNSRDKETNSLLQELSRLER